MTGQDLINGALRLVGALASGENPSTQESNDALEVLNNMIDSWNAQSLAIYYVGRQLFSLASGQASYTLGSGGNFNTARPAQIDRVSIILNNNPSYPIEIPIPMLTLAEYQALPAKTVTSTFPLEVYDDRGFPLRTLTFWPVPTDSTTQVAIYSWQALSSFANLTTDYEFPPGYAKALRYNLAVDLAPEFGVQQINPLVLMTAQESMAVVKTMNHRIEAMKCDPAISGVSSGVYDWRTDGYVRGGSGSIQ